MVYRILLGMIFLATLTGCATTGGRNHQDQLQTRITDLEKKVEEKDSEIVDLQYQVKDISSKVGSAKDSSDNSASQSDDFSKRVSYGADDIIRVNAPVESIQTALKNAGVYSGKIDGKAGAGTKAAIVAFQKDHHLTSDGVLGKKTWKMLKSYLKE